MWSQILWLSQPHSKQNIKAAVYKGWDPHISIQGEEAEFMMTPWRIGTLKYFDIEKCQKVPNH